MTSQNEEFYETKISRKAKSNNLTCLGCDREINRKYLIEDTILQIALCSNCHKAQKRKKTWDTFKQHDIKDFNVSSSSEAKKRVLIEHISPNPKPQRPRIQAMPSIEMVNPIEKLVNGLNFLGSISSSVEFQTNRGKRFKSVPNKFSS